MLLFLVEGILSKLGDDFIPAVLASAGTLLTGYIITREKLLKNELKIDSVYELINNKDELFDNKIRELQQDITEFKEINRETSRSLTDNTSAIKELKAVLYILREQLLDSKDSGYHSKKKPPEY